MTDVFLMGTAGNINDPKRSLWREPIKTECAKFGIECFDPILPVWQEENALLEADALHQAKILVMAITADTVGVASLAESGWTVLSAMMRKQAVGIYIDPEYQGERSAISTMILRLDSLFKADESIEDASRRARKLVILHATDLVQQFPDLNLFIAKDLADLTRWTIATAKALKENKL